MGRLSMISLSGGFAGGTARAARRRTTFGNYIDVIGGSVVLGGSLRIDWNVKGDYPRTPAYKSGVVYAVNGVPVQLEARSEVDGSLLWSWTPPNVWKPGAVQ